MRASIVILTYNNLQSCTIPCLDSVLEHTDLSRDEIIVVDNASTDGTQEWLNSLQIKNLRVILNSENFGYAKGNNIGIAQAQGDFVILLNNDTLVSKCWVDKLIRGFDHDVGLVGPISNRIGSMQQVSIPGVNRKNYLDLTTRYTAKHKTEQYEVEKLCFFCVAIPIRIIKRVGYLDENFGRGNFEDDDYCLRVRKEGFKLRIVEGCFIYHTGSVSFKKIKSSDYNALINKNLKYFETKHQVNYSFENVVRDYRNILQNAKSSEVYLYRKPIYDLVNSSIRVKSRWKTYVKAFDSKYFYGLISFVCKEWKKLHNVPTLLRKASRFYSNFGIVGISGRLNERLFDTLEKQPELPANCPKDIPIFIISFNRLFCLRQLVSYLVELGFKKNIVIIDNASTYGPLVDYLSSLDVKVVRLSKNLGHLALWKCGLFDKEISTAPFILTDCDVLPKENCPSDFIDFFYKRLLKDKDLTKVGFGLEISDLPEKYQRKKEVIEWELQYWLNVDEQDRGFYKAHIDTTFAVYRPNVKPYMSKWWRSLRSNYPYVARHYPWYITDDISREVLEEEFYYQKSAKSVSSHWYSDGYLTKEK